MKLLRAHGQARGSTLLEVALAVAIMAASGVGLIATQLSLSRHAQTAAVRAQAVFIADALAEAAVEGSSGIGAGDQWRTRASVVIPGGAVSIASAVYVIVDLDTPFDGPIVIASDSMRDALAHMSRPQTALAP